MTAIRGFHEVSEVPHLMPSSIDPDIIDVAAIVHTSFPYVLAS